MANPVKSHLSEAMVIGTVEGKDLIKKKTYQGLNPAKTDEIFAQFAQALMGVQQYPSSSQRIDFRDLVL